MSRTASIGGPRSVPLELGDESVDEDASALGSWKKRLEASFTSYCARAINRDNV